MFAAAVVLEDPAILPAGITDSRDLSPDRREACDSRLETDAEVTALDVLRVEGEKEPFELEEYFLDEPREDERQRR